MGRNVGRTQNRGAAEDIAAQAHVVEEILDRIPGFGGWRVGRPTPDKLNAWVRDQAARGKAALERAEELAHNLGDHAPDMDAANLHPWAWDSGKAFWNNGHFHQAVMQAAIRVNSETQAKLSRTDVSEVDLFKQAFSLDDPKPGAPRLRLLANDGSKTYVNLHRGAMAFADGLYTAIRNPGMHAPPPADGGGGAARLGTVGVVQPAGALGGSGHRRARISSMDVEQILAAIRAGNLSTRDLVRITFAVAERGKNTTSVLGQYGEELVAAAYGGMVGSFGQRGYDVVTAAGEKLQVKTYTTGRRAGVIRSFAYDVVTVAVQPQTATVAAARRYRAADLHAAFTTKWTDTYQHINPAFASWGGQPEDRFERGWTIGSAVPYEDVTQLLVAVVGAV